MLYLSISLIIITGLSFQMTSYVLLRSSVTIHNEALKGLVYTFIKFYDQTPIGRIINRMSRDTFLMDEILVLGLTELI